jgi:hypothetical protein
MQFLTMIKGFIGAIPAAYWKWIAIVILCVILGMKIQSCVHHCPKCPEGRGSSVAVRIDTVYCHDTTRGPVTTPTTVTPHITYHKVIQPEIKPTAVDTPKPVIVPDTSYCYENQWTENDGAKIGIKVCSAILPEIKPMDWAPVRTYIPPPQIVKEIRRTDTIAYEIKQPIINKWWFWLPIAIGTGVAGYYAHK